jgi:hypothetical protein
MAWFWDVIIGETKFTTDVMFDFLNILIHTVTDRGIRRFVGRFPKANPKEATKGIILIFDFSLCSKKRDRDFPERLPIVTLRTQGTVKPGQVIKRR